MEDVQLELFTKFFTLEKGESNTLELFDFCTPIPQPEKCIRTTMAAYR